MFSCSHDLHFLFYLYLIRCSKHHILFSFTKMPPYISHETFMFLCYITVVTTYSLMKTQLTMTITCKICIIVKML